jgi:hypothetical protein
MGMGGTNDKEAKDKQEIDGSTQLLVSKPMLPCFPMTPNMQL